LNEHEGIDFEKEAADAIQKKEVREAEDYAEKDEIIKSIKKNAGLLTQDMETVNEKGLFMVEKLKVDEFGKLFKKKNSELKEIDKALFAELKTKAFETTSEKIKECPQEELGHKPKDTKEASFKLEK